MFMIVIGSTLFRQCHRIIEWFGSEGNLKIIWFQAPCPRQGHIPPDQIA